jgi:hypothetical protein
MGDEVGGYVGRDHPAFSADSFNGTERDQTVTGADV